MRITFLFLLLAFALVPTARGQTFQVPGSFTSDNYNLNLDDCYVAPQLLEIPEFGYYSFAPQVVFRVQNTARFAAGFRPWRVTMVAETADLAIFVCRTVNGNTVSNCVDASDNGWGQTNVVDVPGAAGTYWVIVAQNLEDESPDCGFLALTAIHEPQYNSPASVR